MWSAAFSRNPEAEFEIFVGVYSTKRCKSLWGATGPMCHAALCSAEILGGRSGLSVLKKDLWERRKGSWCQISPFFPPLWGIHPAPMTSALISSDAFFQSSFPSHHHTSQPAALSLLQIPVLVWMKLASFFLQDSLRSPVLLTSFCHVVSRVVSIFGRSPSFSWLKYKNITYVVMHFPSQFLNHSDFLYSLQEFSSSFHHLMS